MCYANINVILTYYDLNYFVGFSFVFVFRMSRNRRPDIDDDSCCGLRLLKIIIYFFNFLFYVCFLFQFLSFFFNIHKLHIVCREKKEIF